MDELLDRNASIVNDEYVISEESPLYLTADDVKGVPMPNILLNNPTSIFPTFHTPAHTSQYLRFMVTDYSTAITGEHKLSLYGS
ncbi:MAG: hypothetical protein K2L48_03820 [Mycoplasmoidaceae bacterium]|nr:hypothetical protein [Mycoplasmoidaceae bacterium]